MWEENPRYQQGSYRLLVWSVGLIGVFTLIWSIITGEWAFTGYYFTGVFALLAGVLIYCAIVWGVGHTAALVVRVLRRAFWK
jgi:hypothetical protein